MLLVHSEDGRTRAWTLARRDQLTRWQAMTWDYAGKFQKAQMDVGEIEARADLRL